jgi:hypothetical protein
MIKPLSDWTSSYKDIFYKDLDPATQPLLFRKWVHLNFKGMQELVYSSSVTIIDQSFPPITIPAPGTAITAAEIISSSWMSYVSSAIWAPKPPIPPFSVVASIVNDVALITAAKSSLKAALVSEFTNINGGTLDVKATNMAIAFYTASMSLGVIVSGMSLTVPPVPLIMMSPIT